jgi:hypothetical protein
MGLAESYSLYTHVVVVVVYQKLFITARLPTTKVFSSSSIWRNVFWVFLISFFLFCRSSEKNKTEMITEIQSWIDPLNNMI